MYVLDRWPRQTGLGVFAFSSVVAITVFLLGPSVVWLVVSSWIVAAVLGLAGVVIDVIANRRDQRRPDTLATTR
jgi:hypothetical protein